MGKKRTIRRPNNKIEEPKRPQCRMHIRDMKYDQLYGVWRCEVAKCNMTAQPMNEVGAYKPVLFEECELVVVEGEHTTKFLLRHDKVYFDITQYVVTSSFGESRIGLFFGDGITHIKE